MSKYWMEEFREPGADKRSIPFWSWNGKMDTEEIKAQIRQMKRAGVGGFFIHSRIGLETEYLGAEWMECVRAAVEEAKAQGLYVWLYDEDRWPSGTAGGRVTSISDAFRCKGLTLEVLPPEDYERLCQQEILPKAKTALLSGPWDGQTGLVAVYRAVTDGACIQSYDRVVPGEKIDFSPGEVLLAVRLEVSAPSSWFNHSTPPDNLNPDCVREFIHQTHERYKQAVGEEFGKTVVGIFTDEPSVNDRFSCFGEHKSWIPWTYGFGDFFKKQTGYEFRDVLPMFYFTGEWSEKIRHDYWRCVTQRFSDSYFKTLGQWCEENNLLFTGHLLHEDSMGICTRVNGAAMPHYRYMHVPGIDMLCEQTQEYMTVKQCTSVARQLGKKQVLTETYGCTGWDFTFEAQKWIGDWQYVLGVNRRCQHLMLYSLRGCRKRDYPPNFNYNTNWWKHNKIVEDYFARLSLVLDQGEAVRHILLLHPASSAWSQLGVDPYGNPTRDGERDIPALDAFGHSFNALIEYLERNHLDIDLGDELLIRDYAVAESGKFCVGQASYDAVALPAIDTLLASTCEKLLQYMDQGGLVYVMVPGPGKVGGSSLPKDAYPALTSHKNWVEVASREELIQRLEPYRCVSIVDANQQECLDVLYQLREDEDAFYLFLVNNSRKKAAAVEVRLPFAAKPALLDLLRGSVAEFEDYELTQDGLCLRVHLDATGSALFCLQSESPIPDKNAPRNTLVHRKAPAKIITPEGPFRYSLEHKNILTLDMCRYRLAGGEWSEEMEVWKAQRAIRAARNMPQIISNGIEQRYKWIAQPHPNDGAKAELSFSFVSGQTHAGVLLAIERPEEFSFSLNGERFVWREAGFLLDKEIKTGYLPQIRQGKNELILSCAYRRDMELEMVYLEGSFGVDQNRCLTNLPKMLYPGSWTEQGLLHYCGSVTYHMEYFFDGKQCQDPLFLKLPSIQAVCVELVVNGHRQLIPWNFTRNISIGQWILPGVNRIDIVVVGSPRNMMGPFHLKEKPENTNPGSFCTEGAEYAENYLVVPYGIMDQKKTERSGKNE